MSHLKQDFPTDRESALFFACLDSSQDPNREAVIREMVSAPIDWARWSKLAQHHALAPLAYRRVTSAAPDLVPGELAQASQTLSRGVAARNLHLVQEMHSLRELLAASGIRCLFFKGPLLAADAYGDLGLRASGDVDVLVQSPELSRASQLLMENGFVPFTKIQRLGRLRRKAHVFLTRQIPFRSSQRADVDLHAGVVSAAYHFSISANDLLARARVVNVGGTSIPTLSIEDLVLVLCYQGVNNRWDRLKHVCDLAQHITAHPEIDWEVVRDRAESMGGDRIVLHGLDLARSVTHCDLPIPVQEWMNRARGLERVRALVIEKLNDTDQGLPNLLSRIKYQAGVLSSVRARALYVLYALARRVVTPSLS